MPVKKYIALLRAINVGGKSTLPMKVLATILGDLGCENVRTYLQSGNAVFMSKDNDTLRLSCSIGEAVRRQCGFEHTVLLLQPEKIEKAITDNPFPEAEPDYKALYVRFLASIPKHPDLKALEELKRDGERFQLKGKVFYLFAPNGEGGSKLAANTERLIGVPLTDRNWKTLCTLRDMVTNEGLVK